MSSPINFEHYRVTSKWNEDDFKNRSNQLLTNQIHVLSDAEKKSLAKVLSDHSFVPLSVPKFKETLKDVHNEQAARNLLNMYLNYYMEYFRYKQVARGLIAKLKPSTKKPTKKSATKKPAKKTKRAKSKSKK